MNSDRVRGYKFGRVLCKGGFVTRHSKSLFSSMVGASGKVMKGHERSLLPRSSDTQLLSSFVSISTNYTIGDFKK